MLCLRCDSEEFEESSATVEQEYKGMTLHVDSPVMRCKKCGWFTCDLDQADILRKRTNDMYEFEVWFPEAYPHMNADDHPSVLVKNVINMTKVISRSAWMAAREPKEPDAGTAQ